MTTSTEHTEVVIVGGGIAGAALATVLAREGRDVVVLERDHTYRDRNAGECMMPWGWADAHALGLTDLLDGAAGFPNPEWELTDADGETRVVPVGELHDGASGTYSVGHVAARTALAAAASSAGADVRFGTSDVQIEAGRSPRVAWSEEGRRLDVKTRLIVGADGRGSTVRRQLGLRLERTERTHLIASAAVEGTRDLGSNVHVVGCDRRLMLAVPLGDHRGRLYLVSRGERFGGEDGATQLVEACGLRVAPDPDRWTEATPIGPCATFGGEDAWVDTPAVSGAVLVGDAGGYNSPIIGQGLALAMRDVRLVAGLLLDGGDWEAALFEPYAAERAERLRRARFVAQLWAHLRLVDDDATLRARRHSLFRELLFGIFRGFDDSPAAWFTEDAALPLLAAAAGASSAADAPVHPTLLGAS